LVPSVSPAGSLALYQTSSLIEHLFTHVIPFPSMVKDDKSGMPRW
jgi:hypothetical protein